MNQEHPLLNIFHNVEQHTNDTANKYEPLNLLYNPFPKSGTASLTSPEAINQALSPFDTEVIDEVRKYIRDSLYISHRNEEKFLSATITGNYGSGKTQLLLYIQYLLNSASTLKDPHYPHKNPFVAYIDNPGVKLSELVGSIISKIGEDNFRRLIWDKIITELKQNSQKRSILKPYEPQGSTSLFPNINPDPYAPENTVSYKKFLDVFLYYIQPQRRRDFANRLREVSLEILSEWQGNTIAKIFYDVIIDDSIDSQAWELLSQGSDRSLARKEVELINSIISLSEKQSYTDFYILVDEFEDLTEGRLSKTELDNYLKNLRTLIDHNRKWCVVFAMTDGALDKIRRVSPPLADRLTNRRILLRGFDDTQACEIVNTYLNIARQDSSESLAPFTEDGVKKLRQLTTSNLRRFLKGCFELLERFTEKDNSHSSIDSDFVSTHIKESDF